jgi:outer membrane protein W
MHSHGDSHVEFDGTKAGDAMLDPVVLGVGIGARF